MSLENKFTEESLTIALGAAIRGILYLYGKTIVGLSALWLIVQNGWRF